ncbi:hypothetical protein L596_021623 [Steinernema carpocapsae]|uniref:Uncharacterized protein n=1 Tax=Steinernema carpocapsae TaxID=34508 RepID=A0A4V6XVW5_STECR|nr:hypothetical protein L596_021623 [Steinernema carpocapsae]
MSHAPRGRLEIERKHSIIPMLVTKTHVFMPVCLKKANFMTLKRPIRSTVLVIKNMCSKSSKKQNSELCFFFVKNDLCLFYKQLLTLLFFTLTYKKPEMEVSVV